MSASLVNADGVKASSCSVTTNHVPYVVRFVWHHVMPESLGGSVEVEVCDSCHYSIHRILYYMSLRYQGIALTDEQQALLNSPPRRAQLAIAQQGLDMCIAAGVVDRIPNEG